MNNDNNIPFQHKYWIAIPRVEYRVKWLSSGKLLSFPDLVSNCKRKLLTANSISLQFLNNKI